MNNKFTFSHWLPSKKFTSCQNSHWKSDTLQTVKQGWKWEWNDELDIPAPGVQPTLPRVFNNNNISPHQQ